MADQIKALTLRVPENIHTKLKMLAAVNQTTMTKIIVRLVEHEPLHFPGEVEQAENMLDMSQSEDVFNVSPEIKVQADQAVAEFKEEVSGKQALYEEKQRLIQMRVKAAIERGNSEK